MANDGTKAGKVIQDFNAAIARRDEIGKADSQITATGTGPQAASGVGRGIERIAGDEQSRRFIQASSEGGGQNKTVSNGDNGRELIRSAGDFGILVTVSS